MMGYPRQGSNLRPSA